MQYTKPVTVQHNLAGHHLRWQQRALLPICSLFYGLATPYSMQAVYGIAEATFVGLMY